MRKLVISSSVFMCGMLTVLADYITFGLSPSHPTNSIVLAAGESLDSVWVSYWPGLNGTTVGYWSIETPHATIAGNTQTGGASFALSGLHIAGPATISFGFGGSTPTAVWTGTSILTFNKYSSSPSTVNVIPKGQGAIITLQTTYDLGSEWSTLFSQMFTNSTPTNQFFRFIMSAP